MNILDLCADAAQKIYGDNVPTPFYAQNVSFLLAGTAATESRLEARRQHGMSLSYSTGAWGLWQTESAPLIDSIDYLKAHEAVAKNCNVFLTNGEGDINAILRMGPHGIVRLCAGWDRFACMMARIHYLRFPAPIPRTDEARADYYKKYYNTVAGKGSAEKYLRDYRELIVPMIEQQWS